MRFNFPNNWSCLIVAYANMTGMSPKYITDSIGHDGSEIIWPHLKCPLSRRAFHPQELVTFCYRHGIKMVQFEVEPLLSPTENDEPCKIRNLNMVDLMHKSPGISVGCLPDGRRHAMYWNGFQYIDGLENYYGEFDLEIFYLRG